MKYLQATCVVVVLVMAGGFVELRNSEKKERSQFYHHLTRRQIASEELGPIPLTSRDSASQQSGGGHGRNLNPNSQGTYYTSYPGYSQVDPDEDWLASSDYSRPSYSSQIFSSSNGESQAQSHLDHQGRTAGSDLPQSGQQQPAITSGSRPPTQTHVSGTTRYTFTRPAPVVSGGVREQGRTYTYPFGRANGGGVGVVQPDASGGSDLYRANSNSNNTNGPELHDRVSSTESPLYDPQSTLSPRQQHQQLLRQRNAERQRLLQQRQQQQQQRQQQQQQIGGYQHPVYSSNQQPGGGYTSGLRQPIYGQRPIFTGQIPGQQTPVYGGNYQQGSQPQTVFTYGGYGRGLPFDTASYSSECPDTGIRIQINGIPCEQAVDLHGTFLCYRHEYTSRECCQKCRPLKNPSRIGCEYGDHSGRCTDLRSYDCYDLRNRQSCCATCERLRQTGARAGCEYGDMTPNCDRVRQNPELCYIPENRYLCCDTCHSIRDLNDECPWGDQNSELCAPFDRLGNIRINCYSPPIRRLCCQSCPRIQEWLPGELQVGEDRRNDEDMYFKLPHSLGCEYGDRPVTFSAGTHRSLNCTSFMRYFGAQQCVLNEAVATNCCYTCHRYSQA